MLSALKNFGITFLISALLFGVLAYFATLFVSSTVGSILDDESTELDNIMQSDTETEPQETEPEPDTTVELSSDVELPEGESFNFLIVTNDYRPDLYDDYMPSIPTLYEVGMLAEDATDTLGLLMTDFREIHATSIVLVRADRERQQFVYTYITPQMRVYTSTGYQTLSKIYSLYGVDTLAEYVNAMTGLTIHYTVLVNGYNLEELTELLGPVTVSLPRAIYYDEDNAEYTLNYEHKIEHIGEDGNPWTELAVNKWIRSAGDVEINADTIEALNLVVEHSEGDRGTKQTYTLEAVRAYLTAFTSMEKGDAKRLLELLITPPSEWVNLEGYEAPEEEGGEENPDDGTLPFDPTPVTETPAEPETPTPEDGETGEGEGDGEGEGGDGEEEEEEEKIPLWIKPLFEPEDSAVSTNYDVEAFDATFEMLSAVDEFETVNIAYPCDFIAATDEAAEVFDVRLKDGLTLFTPYRTAAAEQ